MTEPALRGLSVAQMGRLLRKRAVTSVELTKLALEALDERGRALNAVADLTPDLALAQARQADQEIANEHWRGPLHGIPYGAKDLLATRGVPTRWGSPAHRYQVFNYDATVIERLRQAGAVLTAKLSMVELAGGGGYDYPAASLHGPGRNPWNPQHWAGGSSSGSASAVGDGLLPFALGSETWGSIVLPSAFCNVSGLRPTYGRVSRHGAMALCWSLDKIGPMARTAEDCGLVLAAIAGHDPQDPTSAPGRFVFRPRAGASRRFTIGILAHNYEQAPEAQARFAAVQNAFRDLEHQLTEVSMPDFPWNLATGTIVSAEGSAAFEQLIRSPQLALLADTAQQAGLLAGLAVPAVDYLRAQRLRTLAAPAALAVFEQVDALIAPTVLQVAPPIEQNITKDWADMGGNGGMGNLLGWPSISIPMGFGQGDLPLGLEIIGPPFSEATILALAMAYQKVSDWHRMQPAR